MTSSADWSAAAHLVRSVGFGAAGPLVDAVAAAGPAAWLTSSLQAAPTPDPGATATPAPDLPPLPPLPKDATPAQRQQQRRQAKDQVNQLVGWWIARMVSVPNPVVEKLAFGWHNHFATSATKVKSAPMLLAQNERFRALGRGSFTALVEAMVTDPALLLWLDGQQNTATAPNENLARELMELFTLGRDGGYTEQDVREAARALTGWTVDRQRGTAAFVARRHDTGPKTVLGTTAGLDARGLVHVLLAQPTSAPFVATRWWHVLASPEPPPQETLMSAVAAYGPDRDLAAMFRALLTGQGYATAAGSRVASPVEWVVGAMRSLAVTPTDKTVTQAAAALRALGQLPFYPPNVSGWPAGQAWLSTASAGTRVATATMLAAAGDLHTVHDAAPGARVDATAYLLGIPALSNRTLAELRKHTNDPRRLVATALVSPENLVV